MNSAKLQSDFLFGTLLYASSSSALFNYIPQFISPFSFSIPIIDLEPGQLTRCSQCTTGRTGRPTYFSLMFCRQCIIVYQYSEINVVHFSFNLLRIKSLYMFRALLAHPQEVMHKRHFV
jgi:hypothetical protein